MIRRGTLLDTIRERFFSPENRLLNGAMNTSEYEEAKQLQVDFDFISKLEGGRQTEAYVPNPEGSQSGITFGTGVDLGGKTSDYFKGFDNPNIVEKMEPYFGMTGQEAFNFEELNPLSFSQEEAMLVDNFVKGKELNSISRNFERTFGTDMAELSPEVQTVIASIGYQYGANFMDNPNTEEFDPKTPKFVSLLEMVVKDPDNIENYTNLEDELRNFGDDYGTRRGKEADLLNQFIRSLKEKNFDELKDASSIIQDNSDMENLIQFAEPKEEEEPFTNESITF
jgi:hypothetical protein